tara:strand:- start:946 stop:1209 length:264 start_codon:yes stop_codon:yes gene_type:complete
MPKKFYTKEDGNSYNYTLRIQREKYQNDKEFVAYSRLKYYKKKYKDNEKFKTIIKDNISNITILEKVKQFNKEYKLNIKNNPYKKNV